MFTKEKTLLLAASSLLICNTALASGFRIPEVSVTGTALSNAMVANSSEMGSVAYNPANAAFQKDGTSILAGINHISYEASVTPAGGSKTESQGDDAFQVPNLALSVQDQGNLGFAFILTVPFGLETHWPDETFPGFAGALDPLEPAMSRIEMLNLNPNLTYKLSANSSVSIGMDFYQVQDLVFNTQDIKVRGTGDGTGWNIGYTRKINKQLTFATSYRSAVKTVINGQFDATAIGSSVIGASAGLEFPDVFLIGLFYQPTRNLGIELDLDRTGWSSFDEVKVVDSGGTTLTSSKNGWDDSWAVRLGLTYKITPNTKLMFGYSYDESPQPDSYFSARVPDADRQLFSLGVSQKVAGWVIEFAYMYVDAETRTINSSTSYAGDANGTTLYNGTYEADVSLIGLSLATSF